MPSAPTPGPPSSACSSRARLRSQPATGDVTPGGQLGELAADADLGQRLTRRRRALIGASGVPNRCGITTVNPAATTSSANPITSGVRPGISWITMTPGPLPLRYVGWVIPSAVCSPLVQPSRRLMPAVCPTGCVPVGAGALGCFRARCGPRGRRRTNERSLGEVVLRGHGLQQSVIEEPVQHDHGGRVSGEAASGEGVELVDRHPHGRIVGTWARHPQATRSTRASGGDRPSPAAVVPARVWGVAGTRDARSSGLSRTSPGVWWMTRWWWPQSSTRLASSVLPPCSPVDDVVGVAHHRGSGAAGERAVPVAADQGPPQRWGDQAVGAADVEDLAAGAEGDRDEVGVAGQPADHAGGES